jgi:hypothetical protein
MAMIPIAVDEVVFPLLEYRRYADRDRFLAAVKVAEPADSLPGLGVFLVGPLLESADEHHRPEAVTFDLARGFGCNGGIAGGALLINGVGDGHFTNSAKAG